MDNKRTVAGVGFIGSGSYNSVLHANEYLVWRDIIYRCYKPKVMNRRPCYVNCEVDDRWHNFQNFADWYVKHEFSGLGYQVDKDLLVSGNSVYSPDNCCLLPKEINGKIQTSNSRTKLVGTTFHKASGRWQSQIRVDGKQLFLGTFDTQIEAHLAYVEAKEFHIHEIAEKWKGDIEDKAYEALSNWKVDIKGVRS